MSKTDELAKAYSGLLGDQVVVKRGGKGKNVVSLARTRSKSAPSDKQLAVRQRLSMAAQYARNAMLDPALFDLYTSRSSRSISPFRVASNDFLQLPFLRDIDVTKYHGNPGDTISVLAGDKIAVTEVMAHLMAADNTPVEEGPCALDLPSGRYLYTTTVQVANTAGMVVTISVRDTCSH